MADIPVAAPLFVMRPIEEIYDWQNLLFYGDFGSGKTWLAGSAVLVPEMQDILYISLEGGERTLREIKRMCKQFNIDPNRIMVIPVQSYQQYSFVYEFLKIHVKARDANDDTTLRKLEAQVRGLLPQCTVNGQVDVAKLAELIPEPRKFKTVITDSLTEAQKYCMYQILGINPSNQKLDAEPDQAQFQDWGKSREMIQFLVRRYRDLPIHAIFICGEAIEQDARKQFHYEPMLPGKLADDVRGLVDTVGYLVKIPQEGGQVVRRLYLEGGFYGGAHIAAKHRYGSKLKSLWIDNPTMKTLYELGLD
jgi:hypothetical protein